MIQQMTDVLNNGDLLNNEGAEAAAATTKTKKKAVAELVRPTPIVLLFLRVSNTLDVHSRFHGRHSVPWYRPE